LLDSLLQEKNVENRRYIHGQNNIDLG